LAAMSRHARTTWAPTQRSEQWKQRVVREEFTQYSKPSTQNVTGGQHASRGITAVLPGPGSTMKSARAPQSARGSSLSLNLNNLSSARGDEGNQTGRSSIALTGRSIASNWSFDSRCSNLTEKALERIERLERSLEIEREKREEAESKINELKDIMDEQR